MSLLISVSCDMYLITFLELLGLTGTQNYIIERWRYMRKDGGFLKKFLGGSLYS